jgi:hypothetical protein
MIGEREFKEVGIVDGNLSYGLNRGIKKRDLGERRERELD